MTQRRSVVVRRAGFNMVEILIALLIVGIITITVMAFVNDYNQRYRFTRASADLKRIAQAIQLAESRSKDRVRFLSEPGGGLTSMVAPYLVDVPAADPWGFRYKKVGKKIELATQDDLDGQPYIVDEGVGRVMSAGPDGVFNTNLGQDPADLNNDLIENYRRLPWVSYVVGGQVWIMSADGASQKRITTGTWTNVGFSQDGNYFAGIGPGSEKALFVGAVDETESGLKRVVPRPGLVVEVGPETFPMWYPRSSGILFVGRFGGYYELFRYDHGLDQVFRLTDAWSATGVDVVGHTRFMYNDGRVSLYQYTDSNGTMHAISIAADGRLAYNRTGSVAAGIYLVSSSGQDTKMLKRADGSNAWLPVTWLGTDVLVYMTDPASGNSRSFYRINQDGTQDIPLSKRPVQAAIMAPTPSLDGQYVSFFTSERGGGVIKTDGSGYFKEDPNTGDLIVWTESNDVDTRIAPQWKRDSQSFFYVANVDANNGEVRTLALDARLKTMSAQSVYVLERQGSNWVPVAHDGFAGFTAAAYALAADESLMAVVARGPAPGGLYIIPTVGPAGASTRSPFPMDEGTGQRLGLGAGETPVVRWLGQ